MYIRHTIIAYFKTNCKNFCVKGKNTDKNAVFVRRKRTFCNYSLWFGPFRPFPGIYFPNFLCYTIVNWYLSGSS